jgi:hypothetical protein
MPSPTWGDAFPNLGRCLPQLGAMPSPIWGDAFPNLGRCLPQLGAMPSPTWGDAFPNLGRCLPQLGAMPSPTWGDAFPNLGRRLPQLEALPSPIWPRPVFGFISINVNSCTPHRRRCVRVVHCSAKGTSVDRYRSKVDVRIFDGQVQEISLIVSTCGPRQPFESGLPV